MIRVIFIAAAAFLGPIVSLAGSAPAYALTMKECSAKYKGAKDAGSLNGMTWNEFRKQNCGAEAAAAPAKTVKQAEVQASRGGGDAAFPTAVAPKYASESAGKARMHTCLDQYKANKASGRNGGLRWIQKGGGYYSECNKRLRG